MNIRLSMTFIKDHSMLNYIISKRTNTTEKHISYHFVKINILPTISKVSQNIHIQDTIHHTNIIYILYLLLILLYVVLDICGLYWLYQTKPCVSHVWIFDFLKSDHPNGEVACRCQVMPSLLVAKPQAWSPASSTAWTNFLYPSEN